MEDLTTERNADNIVDEPPEEPTREELLQLVFAMTKDWVRLNEFMNQTALRHGWCSDYEDRQHTYNDEFEVMRLENRTSADFVQWEKNRGKPYKSRYHDEHQLTEKMKVAALNSANQRARWEFARLMADLSIKGPVKSEPVKAPDVGHAYGEVVVTSGGLTIGPPAATINAPDGSLWTCTVSDSGTISGRFTVNIPPPVPDPVPAPMQLVYSPRRTSVAYLGEDPDPEGED